MASVAFKYVPQTAATTFAFSFVFILLLCYRDWKGKDWSPQLSPCRVGGADQVQGVAAADVVVGRWQLLLLTAAVGGEEEEQLVGEPVGHQLLLQLGQLVARLLQLPLHLQIMIDLYVYG